MKKVAILGFGTEGLSAYQYFKSKGVNITVFDESPTPNQPVPTDVKFISGKNCFNNLHNFDIVVRFPAIAPSRIATNGRVTSVIKEFFAACPAPIIGVTGSKGKGTVSSIIHLMLQKAGVTAHIAGNIGVPALDILPDVKRDHVVVLELSSFQLWDLQQSPHIAVVLMVEQEHLDIHASMEDYITAKSNITKWQTSQDVTVYLPGNSYTEQIAMQGSGAKTPYTKQPGAYVNNGYITIGGKKICKTSEVRLPGQHNIENACAAITAAWQYTHDTAAMAKVLKEFVGLPHRLQLVSTVGGVEYYDDSFATTPTSAIAALRSFGQPKVIIIGGSDKGADFTQLANKIATSNMRAVILIGTMRKVLYDKLMQSGYNGQVHLFDTKSTMQQIVNKACSVAQTGDAVILSPACASFDMFKNYKDRGAQYIAAVKALKQ